MINYYGTYALYKLKYISFDQFCGDLVIKCMNTGNRIKCFTTVHVIRLLIHHFGHKYF